MSRFAKPPVDTVLDAVPKWAQRCLIEGQGLFADVPVWTPAAFDDLVRHYVDAPDVGEGNFLGKLSTQLAGASPAARWLAVDVAWLMWLFPAGSIGAAKKTENLQQIASFGGHSLPGTHWALFPEVLKGVGSTGAGYNTNFWLEFSYAMLVLRELVALAPERRAALLQPEADLMGWLDSLPLPDKLPAKVSLSPQKRMFRHIWLFLMQPDRFERISSTGQKHALVKHVAPRVDLPVDLSTPARVDGLLLEIRQRLEAQHGTRELDFYLPPLKALWQTEAEKPAPKSSAWLPGMKGHVAEPPPAAVPVASPDASYWLVGAYVDDVDQTDTFVAEGRWGGELLAAFQERVKAVKPGDRIAIKAAHTRKRGLPFDAQGKTVACMTIKARGVVTANPGDGLNLVVSWEPEFVPFVLYHYAYRWAFSRVDAQRWPEVVRWVFEGVPQEPGDMIDAVEDDDRTPLRDDDADGEVARTVAAIAEPSNVIFYGPPGTGKTFHLIRDVLPEYTNDDAEPQAGLTASEARHRYELVTFHPSYSYEDFVEGLRPVRSERTNAIEIVPVPGPLKRICARARRDPDNRYALVIDEINRGNVAKIFGELITLVEADKRLRFNERGQRVQGIEVKLPYTREAFGVPANVDLYGTMNTADRSIALVDIALRRRFSFRELLPDPSIIPGSDGTGQIPGEEGGNPIDLRRLLGVINSRLLVMRGRDALVGHAYFYAVKDLKGLQEVFRERLIPLLQEYFYEDWARVAQVLSVKPGAAPFLQQTKPKVSALFWEPAQALEGLEERGQWAVSPEMAAESFRALYEGIPASALLMPGSPAAPDLA